MTMTFDIPTDVQEAVADIPDLDLRVALYLRHEGQLEAIRRQRHSSQAREIAERAMKQAASDQASGFDWDDSFKALKKQHEAITQRL